RAYVGFKENATDGSREILISQCDPARMHELLGPISKELGAPAVHLAPEVSEVHWALLFPFSHFLDTYSFTINHLAPSSPSSHAAPILSVALDHRDPATDTRTLTLVLTHPHHIWTVLLFDAEVVDWSMSDKTILLDDAGKTHQRRHVIRHAGGHESASWNLTLTVRGAGGSLPVQINGIERDGYHELVEATVSKAKLGRSWRWTDRWGSAEVLARVEAVLPDWTTSLFVGFSVSTVVV
ncbi:hypothetical protein BDK51DRAFT_25885, partial [Blyttiomyces helicus]